MHSCLTNFVLIDLYHADMTLLRSIHVTPFLCAIEKTRMPQMGNKNTWKNQNQSPHLIHYILCLNLGTTVPRTNYGTQCRKNETSNLKFNLQVTLLFLKWVYGD